MTYIQLFLFLLLYRVLLVFFCSFSVSAFMLPEFHVCAVFLMFCLLSCIVFVCFMAGNGVLCFFIRFISFSVLVCDPVFIDFVPFLQIDELFSLNAFVSCFFFQESVCRCCIFNPSSLLSSRIIYITKCYFTILRNVLLLYFIGANNFF